MSGNVFLAIAPYVRQHGLGRCFTDATGYTLPNLFRTVRGPDASFVRAGRLAPEEMRRRGFVRVAPDLAVEVLSLDEKKSELEEKLDDYRVAGVRLVWVVDADRRTVRVLPADRPERLLHEGDTLDGGDVLPGFSCPVRALFDGLDAVDS